MKKYNAETVVKTSETATEFVAWIQRLASKHGNKKFDNLRRLEIELLNDIRDNRVTLAVAEETYLRSSGVTFFGVMNTVELQ